MVTKLKVEGYAEFKSTIAHLEAESRSPIFVLFSGSKNETGQSWCPDCVSAEPVVEEALTVAPEGSTFLYVGVGDRAFWKDPACIFRTELGVTCVPTLVQWGTSKRLLDDQFGDVEVVKMLFEG